MAKTLSIIIPFWENEESINRIIKNALQLSPIEVIIYSDEEKESKQKIQQKYGKKITIVENSKNQNLKEVMPIGEMILFLDAHTLIPSTELNKFLEPLLAGKSDVILNNLEYLLTKGTVMSPNMVWNQLINELIERRDLSINTLRTFPFAITNQVFQEIGMEITRNPIKSQMIIYDKEWRISKGEKLEGISIKNYHSLNKEKNNYTVYLEALEEWIEKKGSRGGISDGGKRLDILMELTKNKNYPSYKKGWGLTSTLYKGKQLSIIIPAQNEERTIQKVILEARKIEPKEIIVVVNGSNDRTAEIASKLGVTIIEYKERLGHNVGRAIGALEAKGDILLFTDSDIIISASELQPFALAVAEGTDLALNDLNSKNSSEVHVPLHIVRACKYGLNLLLNRKELGIASPVAIPHAISRKLLNQVEIKSLVCPSILLVKAIQQEFIVNCVHFVDVMKTNRIRPDQHLVSYSDGGSREEIMNRLLEKKQLAIYQEIYNRDFSIDYGWGVSSKLYNGKQLSVIVPVQDNGKPINNIIGEIRKMEAGEIIVIGTVSSEETLKLAKQLGATTIKLNEFHDLETMKAIGVLASRGDIISFIDMSMGLAPAELRILGDHLEAISTLINNMC